MFYGWSFKSWEDHYLICFDTGAGALAWLHREEYDFRDRELVSETDAKRIAGEYWDDWTGDYPLHLRN